MIKAIFFDVGNTLLNTAAHTSETCRQFLHKHGQPRSLDEIRAAMRAADLAHEAHYHALHDDWARPDTILALWLRYYRRVFDRLAITDPDAGLAHALIAWYGTSAAWQPFPDVHDALAMLAARGLRMGAISDWGPSLTGILHAHGLSRYLDFVLASGNIGFCKPHPQLYRLALQRADVQPDEALHVGDSYYADVRGARAVGITPVLIDRRGHTASLDCMVIHSLHEIMDLLQP